MPPIANPSPSRSGNVMIVDDNPANLKLLENMLRQRGYEVRSFPMGRLALSAAEQEPPDLILLDINMPEMNGYEVCEQLKSGSNVSDIPVIFLSALNAVEDKTRGFQSGGVDYISKPFQFEEVEARVETHLKLRRAQQAEHDLLERTLNGAVGTLWELVQLTSPALALRSAAIRDIVLWITKRMGVKDAWQYELAARLCLMGCIALPEEVFERAYCGEQLSPGEEEMFRVHPERAARLLSKIPRLEVVAEIVRGQLRSKTQPHVLESQKGIAFLQVAMDFDRRFYKGVGASSVLAQLKLSGRFDRSILDALEGYSPAAPVYEVRRLLIRDLRAGMVLEANVSSKDGTILILKMGMILTETWIERLKNFAIAQGAQEPLAVRIPSVAPVYSDAFHNGASRPGQRTPSK